MHNMNVYQLGKDNFRIVVTPERNPKSDLVCKSNYDYRLDNSFSRTKSIIRDTVICNDWDYFCTFTFRNDRSNYDLCQKRILKFFENYKYRISRDFKYLVVPELHRDDVNFHFHGVIRGAYNINIPSHILKKNPDGSGNLILVPNTKNYMRWDSWGYGFFNCSPIKSPVATGNYMSKYISKKLSDIDWLQGRQLVLHSKGLNKPVLYMSSKIPEDFDFNGMKGKHFDYCSIYDNLSMSGVGNVLSSL